MKCIICEKELSFSWTDTHGIAQCWECGVPYVILHYEDDKRVEKPPEIAIDEKYINLCKEYWNETHSRIPGGGYSFPGGQELVTPAQARQFFEWFENKKPLASE